MNQIARINRITSMRDWEVEKMELNTIEYKKKGAIAYVTPNRPEKLNAMNNLHA